MSTHANTFVAHHADFSYMRYAQLWEDGRVLHEALADKPGGHADHTLVSITAAGDHALAMLTLDTARVIATDISPIQQHALRIRMAAISTLDQPACLALLGFTPGVTRITRARLLDQVLRHTTDTATEQYWEAQREAVMDYGLAGVGKFERFFRIFRRFLLPIAHSRGDCTALMEPRTPEERARFYDTRWNNWRWKALVRLFFSEPVVARMGRDPAFFTMAVGHLPTHIAGRIRHALVNNDPSTNPYLSYILFGHHQTTTTWPFQATQYATIRERLDRLDIRMQSIEDVTASVPHGSVSGWNLSDIFEYMPQDAMDTCYASILRASTPEARIAYWNMMATRQAPHTYIDHGYIDPQPARAKALHAQDQAFFYKAFHVDRVIRSC